MRNLSAILRKVKRHEKPWQVGWGMGKRKAQVEWLGLLLWGLGLAIYDLPKI